MKSGSNLTYKQSNRVSKTDEVGCPQDITHGERAKEFPDNGPVRIDEEGGASAAPGANEIGLEPSTRPSVHAWRNEEKMSSAANPFSSHLLHLSS